MNCDVTHNFKKIYIAGTAENMVWECKASNLGTCFNLTTRFNGLALCYCNKWPAGQYRKCDAQLIQLKLSQTFKNTSIILIILCRGVSTPVGFRINVLRDIILPTLKCFHSLHTHFPIDLLLSPIRMFPPRKCLMDTNDNKQAVRHLLIGCKNYRKKFFCSM